MPLSHEQFHRRMEALITKLVVAEIKHINKKLERIERNQRKIMASQADLTAQLNDLGVELGKIGGETQTLLDKIDELGKIITAGGEVTPELQTAFDAVKAQAQVVDDKVPDAPTP